MSDLTTTTDKLLFTPGPITTSTAVKKTALTNPGSSDSAYISHIAEISKKLLSLAHVESPEYEAIIMQGSGTSGIEAVISSGMLATGMLLNISNGADGRLISQIARIHSIPLVELIYEENQLPDAQEIEAVLYDNSLITHVAMVHGETATGIINPIDEIAEIATIYNAALIVDARGTFGAYDIDMKKLGISFLISSSNKCIEGIPDISFALVKRCELEKCTKQSGTLSLDLSDHFKGLDSNGQFRFTPPLLSIIAFHKALTELETEGGIEPRANRYIENNVLLVNEIKKVGFELYLPDHIRGYVITTFLYPKKMISHFQKFCSLLNLRGFGIYPGKLSKIDSFRIESIGPVYPSDIKELTGSVKEILTEMDLILK